MDDSLDMLTELLKRCPYEHLHKLFLERQKEHRMLPGHCIEKCKQCQIDTKGAWTVFYAKSTEYNEDEVLIIEDNTGKLFFDENDVLHFDCNVCDREFYYSKSTDVEFFERNKIVRLDMCPDVEGVFDYCPMICGSCSPKVPKLVDYECFCKIRCQPEQIENLYSLISIKPAKKF